MNVSPVQLDLKESSCHFVPLFFELSLISLCVATGLPIDLSGAWSRGDPRNAMMETELNAISSHDGQSLLL